MVRRTWALLASVLLAFSGSLAADKADDKPTAPAAAKAPAGTWKFLAVEKDETPLWLIRLQAKDGKWSGEVLAHGEEAPRAALSTVAVKDGTLRFTLKAADRRVNFEGKVPAADAARILGSANLPVRIDGRIREVLQAVELRRTTLTGLEGDALLKETIAQSKDNIAVLRAVGKLVRNAAFRRAKPEEVRGWVDRALKVSEPYGARFQQELLLNLVGALNEQDGMAAVTLPFARRAERMLKPKDRPAVHQRTLELLATALDRAGKADEAKEVTTRISKIDYSVRVQPYPPRTGKNNRVVVVELFTGAECPPCVAADLAFDAVEKTFQPSEAILLQYHEHIPALDPLSNAQTLARMKYYAEAYAGQVRGTPTTLFNGSPTAGGGGGRNEAQQKYDQYYNAIVGQLDQPAGLTLKASATRKGDKVEVKAEVADLKDPGATLRLRLVLIEDKVSYKGGNGLEAHHHVVRAFPGGLEGLALKAKAAKQSATVDLDDLRRLLKKDLEADYKKAEEMLPKDIPMEFKNLRLIALVQDDNSREILHAVQVPVERAK